MLVAAANIEEPGTIVSASTLHNTFGFDGEYESKLDFSKTTDQKVAEERQATGPPHTSIDLTEPLGISILMRRDG